MKQNTKKNSFFRTITLSTILNVASAKELSIDDQKFLDALNGAKSVDQKTHDGNSQSAFTLIQKG